MMLGIIAILLYTLLDRVTAAETCNALFPGCETACNSLQSSFGSAVHFPDDDPDFIVWDAKQQEVRSACRITPTSTQQISEILNVLTSNWCRFAIKSGGHARNADDSVSAGGVTIDLVEMKSVEFLENEPWAKVGTGHTLGSLYEALEARNLSFVGGRTADVGIGGYLLGGGLSNWSPTYGLAVDNILEYEAVLANSTTVMINEHSHPDLYFALRGGMNNFCVVTHFTVRVFPQGQIFSGTVTLPVDQREAAAKEAYELTTTWRHDTKMSFWYSYSFNASSDRFSLSFSQAYTKPMLDPPPFRGVNAIPGANTSALKIDWTSNFAWEVTKKRPPGARNLYATIAYYPSAQLDLRLQDIFAEEARSIKHVTGFSPNFLIQPLFEAGIREGKVRGGNALGIDADGPLSMILLTVGWKHAEDDSTLYAFAKRWIEKTKSETKDAGRDYRWMYINYANQQQDPFAGYGEANYQRLMEIQKNVDSMGIFSSRGLCRGYFKLL